MYLTPEGIAARFWALLRSAAIRAYKDDCLEIAKGAAYSALLAFFPVVTALAALLVEARAEEISRTIAGLLYQAVPPGTEEVVRNLFVVRGQRPKWLLIAATLLAIFAASGVMISLMQGFRNIYRIPKGRPALPERAVAMLLVFTCTFPLIGASALIVFGTRIEDWLLNWFGHGGLTIWVALAGRVVRYALAFGSFVTITALAYYFGPNRRQQFRSVLPGAVLATIFWLLSTLAFGWYVRHISNYDLLYGSVGAGLALAVWMYVLAVNTLFGCEFNAALERSLKRTRQK